MERREDTGEGLSLDAWLEVLASLPELARVRVTRDEQRALLDLTRIAAHRSERIAAPISAYMVGLLLASVSESERAERIRRLATALEVAPGATPRG